MGRLYASATQDDNTGYCYVNYTKSTPIYSHIIYRMYRAKPEVSEVTDVRNRHICDKLQSTRCALNTRPLKVVPANAKSVRISCKSLVLDQVPGVKRCSLLKAHALSPVARKLKVPEDIFTGDAPMKDRRSRQRTTTDHRT